MAVTHPSDPMPDAPVVGIAALGDMRAERRRRRLGDVEWGDLAYRVYVTGLACLTIGLVLSGAVGDQALDAGAVESVRLEGPAWAGLGLAVVVLLAVRSGSRGGPLALEAAEVHHVLLAPVDRSRALRAPVVSVLSRGGAIGAATLGLAGSLMSQRLPGGAMAWMAPAALFGAAMALTALGAALLTASRVVPSWVPVLAASALVLWSVADVAGRGPTAPATYAGRMVVWPLHEDGASLGLLALAVALPVAGALRIGGLAIEQARRRTDLVGQLRFAVTQQDMRSVVLLRRQLASERARRRRWFPVPGLLRRWAPVTARGLESTAHWPPIRILRVAVLAAGAGLALRGMYSGTTPLVIVAGLAAWVAGLDALEPLAQEVDHPTLVESLPLQRGRLLVRHLVAPTLVMFAAGLVGLFSAWVVDPSGEVLAIGAVAVVTGCLGAVAGAAVSVVSASEPDTPGALMPPEVLGPRLVFRTVWPPLVSMIGFVPVLVAARASNGVDPVGVAVGTAVPALALMTIIAGWVRFRDDIHGSIAEATGANGR